jgi:enediyne biosynthesis protein E5
VSESAIRIQSLNYPEMGKSDPVAWSTACDEAPPHYSPGHLGGLRRFAASITVLTILGHVFLGFEQSYAQPLVSLAAAYSTQLVLEWARAWSERRRPRFAGGVGPLADFLLSAHIPALSLAMLLYYHERLWVVAFASSLAIASKTLFRLPTGSGTRHFLNPSNFGLVATLLSFPSVGLAMPWQYTAGLSDVGDWAFIAILFLIGSFLNIRFTRRFGVVIGFLAGFVAQAVVRWWFFGAPLAAALMPATGVSAMIFTFYMVTDPATTPERAGPQLLFGASVAALYLVFMIEHIVFGLFYALTIVCAARGVGLAVMTLARDRRPTRQLTA